ncbi:MAG TPA: HypC/HybG/HupF family hydrogenase formation chaperone [Ktedonobacteraceae bacterium]|nr:HypC/HybG/HupF family hydrogenase formation chaperone [Ktedonobacteraceae bacterium]
MSYCERDAEGHCITCADEALPANVLRVDGENGLALVTIGDSEVEEEIDITLVDDIAPGDVVLVHGGVAIAQLE